jgi:hypothetical protein
MKVPQADFGPEYVVPNIPLEFLNGVHMLLDGGEEDVTPRPSNVIHLLKNLPNGAAFQRFEAEESPADDPIDWDAH